jgi:hypothetical protein
MVLNSASTSCSGTVELVALVERVEDLALHRLPAHLAERGDHLLTHRLAQRGEVFEAQILGELVVERRRPWGRRHAGR